MNNRLFVGLFGLVLLGCSEPEPVDMDIDTIASEAGLAEDEYTVNDDGTVSIHAYDEPHTITKDTFEGDWALTVDSGVIDCQDKAVSFTAPDGTVYALTGFSRVYSKNKGLNWQTINPDSEIWLDNPDIPGAKISISDMINAGLDLCEDV